MDSRPPQKTLLELPNERRSFGFRLFRRLYKVPFAAGASGLVWLSSCFVVGYVVSVSVAIFAGTLSASLLDLDAKHEREMLIIIAGLTLIVASLMLLIGSLSDFPIDID